MYLIPKELNSKIKITKNIYLKEFFLFLIGMGLVFALDSLVYSSLILVYYIFSTLVIIFLISPARYNPEKLNYEAMYYTFTREKKTYHAISISETKNSNNL
ncbi:DUF5592 family protein [Clostridium estertheticum]|uniref:DUF5592 family protein n=1 Tax=Clostridium estertheticum TaxID=238834 RepID=UPI001CF4E381|nr:DUF5592 family protein [Clostridium estertheticum]MCB2309253.1 DUF5592 family protein [Clostridium estertheticum]MCB2346896.1 DUF5592 family protein [Clostridium estertheticum]MCB2352236.1 DUF5592 family protein [Clostridium estertheticum]WAG48559.1 DUF5592 family protein [Clostridium estertheticum]